MSFSVKKYSPEMMDEWNALVERSNGGTLFHRLDFLAYHGDRFAGNEHHLVIYKGATPCGVMPLGIFEDDGGRIAKSPYGGSYGGPVVSQLETYRNSHEIIEAILEYLNSQKVVKFILTLPISICYRVYSDTFRLVLLERGFRCVNREISSVVCLNPNRPVTEIITSRARNMERKARKAGIRVVERASLEDFWSVMQVTFDKHGTSPTHTFNEWQWLCEHLPNQVYADVAYSDDQPIAGIGYFVINDRVNSSFYFCQDINFQQTQALSLLVYQGLLISQSQGVSWFDFGTSSVNMQGRENIFSFKESFGSVGLFRETYVWTVGQN